MLVYSNLRCHLLWELRSLYVPQCKSWLTHLVNTALCQFPSYFQLTDRNADFSGTVSLLYSHGLARCAVKSRGSALWMNDPPNVQVNNFMLSNRKLKAYDIKLVITKS